MASRRDPTLATLDLSGPVAGQPWLTPPAAADRDRDRSGCTLVLVLVFLLVAIAGAALLLGTVHDALGLALLLGGDAMMVIVFVLHVREV